MSHGSLCSPAAPRQFILSQDHVCVPLSSPLCFSRIQPMGPTRIRLPLASRLAVKRKAAVLCLCFGCEKLRFFFSQPSGSYLLCYCCGNSQGKHSPKLAVLCLPLGSRQKCYPNQGFLAKFCTLN